jgi:DNA polymerase III epsilon subunit-like protein
MPTSVVFDLEADGFNPTQIYVITAMIEGEIYSLTDYDDMRRFFKAYDVYIGHYITIFDLPVVERILDIKIAPEKVIVDTLCLSWYLYPERQTHGLEEWGEEFGIPKPKITDWLNLPIETYIHRCEEDVKINQKLWDKQLKYLNKLYPDGNDFWRFIRYMTHKMDCVREQHEEKWKLDVEYVEKSVAELSEEKAIRFEDLKNSMPKVPVKKVRKVPKVMFTKDGSLSANGIKWRILCADEGFPPDYEEDITVITGYEDANPNSGPQLKAWLYGLGWVPRTFKYEKTPDGSTRSIPQLNKPHGAGICDSILSCCAYS